MKPGQWHWLKRLPALLAVPRPEPAESAQRTVALQRNIIMPARVVVLAVVFYLLLQSPWHTDVVTNYGVVLETIYNFFASYAMLTLVVGVLFYVVRRFPPGIVQWIVFVMGLGDGVFLGGLTVLTGGFGSILYWVYPGLIILNAISIPLATPQIVLNLMLSVFYLGAGLIESNVHLELSLPSGLLHKPKSKTIENYLADYMQDLPALVVWLKKPPEPMPGSLRNRLSKSERAKLSTPLWDKLSDASRTQLSAYLQSGEEEAIARKDLAKDLDRILFPSPTVIVESESPESAADPYVLRVAVLLLVALCCYGVQVLGVRQLRAAEEQKEFLVRTEQLRGAGRLAAEFAHQIKNPLAIINNVMFSLQKSCKEVKPEAAKQIAIVQEEVAKADRVITQIMDYAQLSEGRVEKLNVTEELDRVIEEIFPSAIPTGTAVERQYEGEFPPLLMQRRHFSESVANLLLNARETLNGQGHVRLEARCHGDYNVEVSVRDDGPGIPPDKLEQIFEAYYTTKKRGTGLGLAIVKHNVELYGGSVRVESELGKGARFTLVFPAKTLVKLDS